MFNMQEMLSKTKQMQEELERIQKEAANKTVVGESGGGMIKVTMNGANRVLHLDIAPDLIVASEKEMLEDLIVAAMNNAATKAALMMETEMSALKGLMPNIPGLF